MFFYFFKKLTASPLSKKEQGLFAERLTLLLGASLSLPESIRVMRHIFGRRRSAAFSELEDSLQRGTSFERALADSSLGFSKMVVLAARIGERSGTLSESLRAVASRIERNGIVTGGFISAMAYPAIIFLASTGIIMFLVFFIMPKIMPTILNLHVPLPAITQWVMSLSHFLIDEWWKLLISASFVCAAMYFFYKKIEWFKDRVQRFVLRTPFISRIMCAYVLSDIFDTVFTLTSSGCPFIEAIAESSNFVSFISYRKALSIAVREMQSGLNFSSVIALYPRLFPRLTVDSLFIGEQTGNIEGILSHLGRYYARELATAITGFSKLIEPALMIAVGIIVGAAALSIVLPIYEISQHLSG